MNDTVFHTIEGEEGQSADDLFKEAKPAINLIWNGTQNNLGRIVGTSHCIHFVEKGWLFWKKRIPCITVMVVYSEK
jgi:hypothetical protein